MKQPDYPTIHPGQTLWIDEAALPDILWLTLERIQDGWAVRSPDSSFYLFETETEATSWLSQEGYIPSSEVDQSQ